MSVSVNNFSPPRRLFLVNLIFYLDLTLTLVCACDYRAVSTISAPSRESSPLGVMTLGGRIQGEKY